MLPPPALLGDTAMRLSHGGRSWRIDRAAVQSGDGAWTLVAAAAQRRRGDAGGRPAPKVRLSATRTPDRLTLRVVDGDPGVEPVHCASIFLPFFTTKTNGNGIGLAAARQIAQVHDGGPGGLTTFEMLLPG